ncbi:MAG: hypothetical protein C0598_02365 [Marinilabiliales bacterium]|nr:MAG: hypothetical protein C0598_02365 [Marinilabiliales bacterium]
MEYLKNLLKSFMTLSKSEQKGIFILFVLIFIISIINILIPLLQSNSRIDFDKFKSEINQFNSRQNQIEDSLFLLKKQSAGELTYEEARKLINPIAFNPNKIDKSEFLDMGFNEKQFRTIKNYLEKGGRFREKEDFRKIYCVSDAEYNIIEPFLQLETDELEIYNSKKNKNEDFVLLKKVSPTPFVYTEINAADSSMLACNLKLKAYLIERVIKYRKLLGGYYNANQLMEVYGFPEYYFDKIEPFLAVDTTLIDKLGINNIEFRKLLKHPYFDYETTKTVFKSKPKNGFSNFREFKEKTSINDSIANKIKHYLYFGAPN